MIGLDCTDDLFRTDSYSYEDTRESVKKGENGDFIRYYEKCKILVREKYGKSKASPSFEPAKSTSKRDIVAPAPHCHRLRHTNFGFIPIMISSRSLHMN